MDRRVRGLKTSEYCLGLIEAPRGPSRWRSILIEQCISGGLKGLLFDACHLGFCYYKHTQCFCNLSDRIASLGMTEENGSLFFFVVERTVPSGLEWGEATQQHV